MNSILLDTESDFSRSGRIDPLPKVNAKMPSLELKDVRKQFGDVEVIHGVSLTVEKGEFLVLVGPSGCGKSTLLRMIAGLEGVTSGEVCINGECVNQVAPKDRDIAMVFQSYALYPHMSVAENMGFSLKIKGEPKTQIESKVNAAAEILGLEPYLERFPKQLSGGQRQRVAMGRTIVRDPELFLFDEPLSNLDAKMRVQMRTEINALHKRLGNTMVYVTHDQVEAMTMADKIVVLKDGVAEQIGAPLELYDKPANRFVGEFIGSPMMNVFSGKVNNGDFIGDDGVVVPMPEWVRRHNDRSVDLGVRPEHLKIVGAGENAFEAEIVVVEPTGVEILMTAKVGAQSLSVIYREPLPEEAGQGVPREKNPYRTGEKIFLSPRHIHLFDRDTGLRL